MKKKNGKIMEITNPYNNQYLGEVFDTSPEEIDTILEKAKKAQQHWKQVPVYQRVELVKKFLFLVEAEQESLAKLLSMESGKIITEARKEISNIFIAWNAFSEKIKHLYDTVLPGETESGQERNFTFTKREPLGIVACILPFNFPCNLFNQKVAPALLSGNAAIIKPPCQNPLTICRLTALLIQAGFPTGIVQVVTGSGSVAGHYLCSHPEVHAISLTGSTQVGLQVAETAGKTLKTLSLELGGNDAFLLLEDGDVSLAAEEAVTGRFYNAGQICCAPKRFLIHKSLCWEFLTAVTEKTKMLHSGDPLKRHFKASQITGTIDYHISHYVF